jgi:alpha-galactosidase/6-phospho-beta-glucosidase family protein
MPTMVLGRTTDRKSALPGAEYVMTGVEVDRFQTWEQRSRIPEQLGVKQSAGENGVIAQIHGVPYDPMS